MKAIVCDKPGEFSIVDRPRPIPVGKDVLVRMRSVGVCGTDLHAYAGNQPFFSYPRVLGHELAVEVLELGPDAASHAKREGYRVGDLVAVLPYYACGDCIACRSGRPNCCATLRVLGVHVDGGMQEFVTVPADYLVPAPGLKSEQLALVECFGVGFHGVRRGAVAEGENVLVIGAGPIGIGAMHGARVNGARVIALDINEKRLAYCREIVKVAETIDARSGDPLERVRNLTGGDYPSVVIDATGNPKSMMGSFNYACQGARVVFLSLVNADITFKDPEFHRREITLLASRNSTKEDFAKVIASISNGRVDTTGFVTHRAGADRAIGEFVSWTQPETGVIKAVVEY